MRNGYNYQTPRGRQQNGYQDNREEPRGRQYNFNERQTARNQPDGEDGSPTRAHNRRGQPGVTPRGKPAPRGNEDNRTPRKPQNARKQNGRQEDDESDHSRGNSPTDEVMAKRIEEMESVKGDTDDKVEF